MWRDNPNQAIEDYAMKVHVFGKDYAMTVHVFAKLCVPDVVKNLNVKVFNLMSRTNETRHRMA